MKTSWLTRPLFSSPRVAKALYVGVPLLIVLIFFSPGVWTLSWHLRHGNSIQARDRIVFVPLRWTAEIDSTNGASMTKLPLAIPLIPAMRSSESVIGIDQEFVPRGETLADEYKTWESLNWNGYSDAGQAISGPIRMGSGAQETFCMVGTKPGTNVSDSQCLILGGKWNAMFMGDKKDLEDFFTIIQKVK
jgi:hypothetical protein